jgi:hypothetical protein
MPLYQTYSQKTVPGLRVALPPWDYDPALTAPQRNHMTATVTITEVGDVPWLLDKAAKLLHENKDTLTASLIDLGKKYAESVIK